MSTEHKVSGPEPLPATLAMVLAFALLSSATPAGATIRAVPQTYPTIQSAIDASVEGDTVLLEPGTYRGAGNRNIEFRGKDIVLTSRSGPEATIIDCEHATRGFYIHEWESSSARIDGVTVMNGQAPPSGEGGGILCEFSSPMIINCRIMSSQARYGGGLALAVYYGSIVNCFISGNAAGGGGGLYYENTGGAYLSGCIITGNTSGTGGGGVGIVDTNDTNIIYGCTISGNTALNGGGLYTCGLTNVYRSILLDNCATNSGDDIVVLISPAHLYCTDYDAGGIYTDWGGRISCDSSCIQADPMFCGPVPCSQTTEGVWTLNDASPCLPERTPCGELLGALGIGCGVTEVPTLPDAPDETMTLSGPRPSPSRGAVSWELSQSSAREIRAQVFSVDGRRVRAWPARFAGQGTTTLTWDGLDDAGTPVAEGRYFMVVTAERGLMRRSAVTLVR